MARGTLGDSNTHARRRALWTLGLFALGTLLGARAQGLGIGSLAIYVLAGAGLVLAIGTLGPRRARSISLGLCVLLLGSGWVLLRTDPDRADRLGTLIGEIDASIGRVPIEVRGIVSESSRVEQRVAGLADPPMWPDSTNRSQLSVRSLLLHESDSQSQWVGASGELRLVLPAEINLRAGQRVELLGKFAPSGQRRNPGEPDWAMRSAQRALVGTLVIDQPEHAQELARGGLGDRVLGSVRWARANLRARALTSIGLDQSETQSEAGAMRSALLLGQREAGFDDVFGRFQRVGVAHVLAISGFHLALVVLMLALGVRLLGEHPKLEALVVLIALMGVVVLIPLRPPIVRASLIVGAMLLATRIGRRYDRMTILAWVGVVLLLWRPLDASSMGYQLSMGVTALLVTLSDRHQRALLDQQRGIVASPQPPGIIRRAGIWLWSLFKMNLACWALALPVVMYHAGVVGVLAPIASVLLVPMVALLMGLGYLQIIIGTISPELAQRTMWLIESPSEWTLGLVTWIDTLGFAWVRVPVLSAWWSIGAVLVVALLITRRMRWDRPLGLLLMLLIVALGVAQPMLSRPSAPLRAVMLDVGDGSCVLLQSGGHGVVWDCGSLDRRVGRWAAQSARAMGISDLRDAVVTHDNLDHFNALPELARNAGIERVWITPRLRDEPSPAWSRVRADLESLGIEFRTIDRGRVLVFGDASLEFLWPVADDTIGLDQNDTSAVALVRGHFTVSQTPTILLTGDIEGAAMDRIRADNPELPELLNRGVLELPHHGSARSAAFEFVDWLDPSVVLQSTGPGRLNDERWSSQRTGRDWFATPEQGAPWITIDKNGELHSGWWWGTTSGESD